MYISYLPKPTVETGGLHPPLTVDSHQKKRGLPSKKERALGVSPRLVVALFPYVTPK
jgi:hypothetical protein